MLNNCTTKGLYNINHGLYCNQDANCKRNDEWCRSDSFVETCNVGNKIIHSIDTQLCGDHEFLRDQDCNLYYDNGTKVSSFGLRCWGTMQHCVYPWIYDENGYPGPWLLRYCEDKSESVFHVGTTCPRGSVFLQIHNVVTKKSRKDENWFEDKMLLDKRYEDPYGCFDSCLVPGPGCAACTNEEYFLCKKSGVCIHPTLLCDGHPQCQFGEDEAIDICLDIWVRYNTISAFATLQCSSKNYPGMPTLATACDGNVECSDWSDEISCQKQSLSTYLLIGTVMFISIAYLALKYSRKSQKLTSISNGITTPVESILFIFEKHHDEAGVIAEVNTYLFHIIHTHTTDEIKEICKKFFDLEAKIYDNDEAKIYHSLHQRLDPFLVMQINEAVYPGLTQKTINILEKCFCSRFITRAMDKVTKTPWLKALISSLVTITKIAFHYADVFKDTFLTVTLLNIIGGPSSILLYPTQFSSVIVLGLSASIILPTFASSLHLAINNPTLLFNFEVRRSIIVVICMVCSFLSPILLINHHEESKNKLQMLARNKDKRLSWVNKKCRNTKTQLVEFMKIELGKLHRSRDMYMFIICT